jgi:hypothetical protein
MTARRVADPAAAGHCQVVASTFWRRAGAMRWSARSVLSAVRSKHAPAEAAAFPVGAGMRQRRFHSHYCEPTRLDQGFG